MQLDNTERDQNMDKQVPVEISKQLSRWAILAKLLRAGHAFLSITALLCSLLVSSDLILIIPRIAVLDKKLLAFIAALSVGLLSGFDLGAKSNRQRRAWRKLNTAIIRYKEELEYPVESLIKAYEDAEEIIGDVKDKN